MTVVGTHMNLRELAADTSISIEALLWVHKGIHSVEDAWTPENGYAECGDFELLPDNAQEMINSWDEIPEHWPWPHLPGPGRILDICTEAKVSLLWYAEQMYDSGGA